MNTEEETKLSEIGRVISTLYIQTRISDAMNLEVSAYNQYVKVHDNEEGHREFFSEFEEIAYKCGATIAEQLGLYSSHAPNGEAILVVSHNGFDLAHNRYLIAQLREIKKVHNYTVDVLLLNQNGNNIFLESSDVVRKVYPISKGFIPALRVYLEYVKKIRPQAIIWNSAPPLAAVFLGAVSGVNTKAIYYSMRYRSLNLGGHVEHLSFPQGTEASLDASLQKLYSYCPFPLSETINSFTHVKKISTHLPKNFYSINRKEKLLSKVFLDLVALLLSENRGTQFYYTCNSEPDIVSQELCSRTISSTQLVNLKWVDFFAPGDMNGVALDTFPFAGGLTTVWLMEIGLPVVSWCGVGVEKFLPSSVMRLSTSQSLLDFDPQNAAIVAVNSPEEYCKIANVLMTDESYSVKLVQAQDRALTSLKATGMRNAEWLHETISGSCNAKLPYEGRK